MINIKKLNVQEKIKLFKDLYKDLSGKGIGGDTELAHINKFESTLLKSVGGQGSINPTTGFKNCPMFGFCIPVAIEPIPAPTVLAPTPV